MALEDGHGVGSMLLSSSDFKQTEDVLSHEDIAWIDSCLTQDPEIVESDWEPLKQALLETLESSAVQIYNKQNEDNGIDTIMTPSVEESKLTKFLEPADANDLISPFLTDEADQDSENSRGDESSEPPTSLRSPFLPNYKEFPDEEGGEESATISSGFNLEAHENEPTSKDIFKVWELEMPEEEDEFGKELNKALAASEGSTHESSPSQTENYPGKWKAGDEDLVLGLVAGIADLSLDL